MDPIEHYEFLLGFSALSPENIQLLSRSSSPKAPQQPSEIDA